MLPYILYCRRQGEIEMKLKYQSVLNDLENKIITGVWPEGAMIPTELELCDKYEVSRITIRRALDEMVRAGMIERARGRGTFVRGSKQISDHYTSGHNPFHIEGIQPIRSKIIKDIEYAPGSDIAVNLLPQFNLDVKSGESLRRILIVRYASDTPYAVMNIFTTGTIARMIDRESLVSKTFIKVYEEVSGTPIVSVKSSIATIVPDQETCDLLGTRPTTAQLWMKGRAYTEDGQLVAINYSVYDGNLFEYTVSVDYTKHPITTT